MRRRHKTCWILLLLGGCHTSTEEVADEAGAETLVDTDASANPVSFDAGVASDDLGAGGDDPDARHDAAPSGTAGPVAVEDAGPDAAAGAGAAPEPTPCDEATCDPEESSCAIVQGAPVCTCAPGYADVDGNGKLCEGIDECATGVASCADNALCFNTPSAYRCVCAPGFHGDGTTACEPNSSCEAGASGCSDQGYCYVSSDHPVGHCRCGTGFEGNGVQCSEVDECARGVDDCHGVAECVDDERLFRCQCPDGYLGDGHGDAGCFEPSSWVTDPRIPAVADQPCPDFPVGTSTLSDLGGITLRVGEKATTAKAPLLFYWHGFGGSAADFEKLPEPMRDEIEEAGGIIVSFETSTGTDGSCSGFGVFARDDFAMADRLVACAVRDHNVDPRRIYVTGIAVGGLQAGCMAASRSGYVAAVVSNSGGLAERTTMQAAHAPAVLAMFGPPSPLVSPDFRQTSLNLAQQIRSFGGEAVICEHPDNLPSDELYLQGWEFMKAHPFGARTAPYAAGLPTGFPSYCERYAGETD